jgi:hypothetical protein
MRFRDGGSRAAKERVEPSPPGLADARCSRASPLDAM